MGQLERVRMLLERLTYKPGWELWAEMGDETAERARPRWPDRKYVTMGLYFKAQDAGGPGEVVVLGQKKVLAVEALHQMNEEMVTREIMELIRQAEWHETCEWFKLDGACVTNPHPEAA